MVKCKVWRKIGDSIDNQMIIHFKTKWNFQIVRYDSSWWLAFRDGCETFDILDDILDEIHENPCLNKKILAVE